MVARDCGGSQLDVAAAELARHQDPTRDATRALLAIDMPLDGRGHLIQMLTRPLRTQDVISRDFLSDRNNQ